LLHIGAFGGGGSCCCSNVLCRESGGAGESIVGGVVFGSCSGCGGRVGPRGGTPDCEFSASAVGGPWRNASRFSKMDPVVAIEDDDCCCNTTTAHECCTILTAMEPINAKRRPHWSPWIVLDVVIRSIDRRKNSLKLQRNSQGFYFPIQNRRKMVPVTRFSPTNGMSLGVLLTPIAIR
jgi:hypothetical protein